MPPPDELEPVTARETYDAFAAYYDDFTAHHDHDAWTTTLEGLARQAGLDGKRLLDVACGTGKSFLPMLDRGYSVTACDVSARMVERAAAKAPGRVRAHVCDMRRLPRYGDFDLVWCLDDAVNYLLTTADLTAGLAGMRRNLAPGGVLIFDVNSLWSYRTFFASLSVVPSADRVLLWEGEATPRHPAGGVAGARVQALERVDDLTWRRTEIVHRQRHHAQALVGSALADAGLRCAGLWGMQLDGSTREGFDELANSKAVYVCRADADGS